MWFSGTELIHDSVDFDTDRFLPGASCRSSCGSHSVYDPSQIITSQDVGQSFSLSYGDEFTTFGSNILTPSALLVLPHKGKLSVLLINVPLSSFQSSLADGELTASVLLIVTYINSQGSWVWRSSPSLSTIHRPRSRASPVLAGPPAPTLLSNSPTPGHHLPSAACTKASTPVTQFY
jgi:hypothetical protein